MVRLALRIPAALAVAFATPSSAETFLANRAHVSKDEVERAFMLDMSNSEKIARFQDELRPMYQTLPKNEHGQLESSTVRYALHRYFVHKHGWYVKGLDPQGAGLGNTASPKVVSDVVPAYILNLFEQQSKNKGLQLHELAVFAATLSDLIFQEGFGGMWEVYQRMEFSSEEVSEDEFDLAVRAYFSELVCGEFFDFQTRNQFSSLEAKARDFYPEYDDIMMWAGDLRKARDFFEQSIHNPFVSKKTVPWERAAEHLEELIHNFGSLTKHECRGVKEQLLTMEIPGTGRVRLSDFYSNRELQIHESVDYLRNLGTLEDEMQHPRLIVSNYLASASRCTPFSSYFSICCPDECEGIMSTLEARVGAPQASASRVAEVVSSLSSDTKVAPWNISSKLETRLHEIARHHSGTVPLHGRLFMQWMHHAFPAECQFPHVSGTTNPVSQDEWLAVHQHLDNVDASPEEKAKIVQQRAPMDTDLVDLPWTDIEELVAEDRRSRKPQLFQNLLRIAMAAIALVSFAMPLTRAAKALLSGETDKKSSAHLV